MACNGKPDTVSDFTRDYNGVNTTRTATVTTVAAAAIRPLQRFRSGSVGTGLVEPTVTATVTLAAGSVVEVDKTGLAAGTYDLTGPGVTVVDQGATLPAGVTLTAGKLVLVVT